MAETSVILFVILCSVVIALLVRSYIITNFSPFKEERYARKLIQYQIKEREIKEQKELKEWKRITKEEYQREESVLAFERFIRTITIKNEIRKEELTNYLLISEQIREMPEYSNWKNEVFQRDGRYCMNEGCESNENLEIHHIKSLYSIIKKYKIDNKEEASMCNELWDVNNGKVLCRECHKRTENYVESLTY